MENHEIEPRPGSTVRVDVSRDTSHGVVLVQLAHLPERALLDETAVADALGVSKRTIRRMAGRGELPPPVRLAGRSMWQAGRVLAWFEARADRAAREAGRATR